MRKCLIITCLLLSGIGAGGYGCRPVQRAGPAVPKSLTVCSFNIQFLGHFKDKDNAALAEVVSGFDIVLVQELVAPPVAGTYPDGEPYTADPEAAAFFEAMEQQGFSWRLSPEDTGSGETIHTAGPATEWWVAFYRPGAVRYAADLPVGFLAPDRSNHADYERVPYAFGFRSLDDKLDFVLIPVHLNPGASTADRERRRHELAAVVAWVEAHDAVEQDFIIVGDMNIEGAAELVQVTPTGWVSLNDECRPTNTHPHRPRPYDHVMFRPQTTPEMDVQADLGVIDLVAAVRPFWTDTDEPFPGDPYDHNRFRQVYSDHHPITFSLLIGAFDDD